MFLRRITVIQIVAVIIIWKKTCRVLGNTVSLVFFFGNIVSVCLREFLDELKSCVSESAIEIKFYTVCACL